MASSEHAPAERGTEARPGAESFAEALAREALVLFDGAMGTVLYDRGVFLHRPFEAANLDRPALVERVHRDYLQAGAHVLQANTFAANRFRLASHGLQDEVASLNRAAVRIAREASEGRAWVAGSVGPLGLRIEPFGAVAREEARAVFAEQVEALLEEGVDLLVLETFGHLPELLEAVAAVRALADVPVVACVTVRTGGRTVEGVAAAEAARQMVDAGADAVGANCADALALVDALEQMRAAVDVPLLGQPNAGSPRTVAGRSIYMASPDYLAAWGRRALRVGVRLLGGCCGTTPEHIAALRRSVHEAQPELPAEQVERSLRLSSAERRAGEPVEVRPASPLARALAEGSFPVGVELTPPRAGDLEPMRHIARRLAEQGRFTFVSLREGSPEEAALPPAVAAVACREAGLLPLVHYACRGRRLVRMQSDLVGLHALGVRDVLLVTGEPLDAAAVPVRGDDLEVDSIGAVHLAHRLGLGRDLGGNPLTPPAALHVAVRLDPTAHDRARELARYRWKREAGAHFAVTVPIFDVAALDAMLAALGEDRLPVVASLWPLSSAREAEFFEHELAHVPVPPPLVERMRRAEQLGRAEQEGVAIAAELAAALRRRVEGMLVVAPDGDVARAFQVFERLA